MQNVVDQIDRTDPMLALLRYHLLFAPPHERKAFYYSHEEVQGAIVIAKNEVDQTAPMVLAWVNNPQALRHMLDTHLLLGKRYMFILPERLTAHLMPLVSQVEYERRCLIYTSSARAYTSDGFEPSRTELTHGCFAYSCSNEGTQKASEARTNWLSDRFGEISVKSKKEFRGLGLAKAAVASVTNELLKQGRQPLYVVDEANIASIKVCTALGFHLTGVEIELVARYHPTKTSCQL